MKKHNFIIIQFIILVLLGTGVNGIASPLSGLVDGAPALSCGENVDGLPTVTTGEVGYITRNTAVASGNVVSDGGATVTERGVCWSLNPNPTVADNHQSEGSGTGLFTSNLANLHPNTTYYLRAYATNSEGTVYGNQVTFKTLCTPITTRDTVHVTAAQMPYTYGNTVFPVGSADSTEFVVHYTTLEGCDSVITVLLVYEVIHIVTEIEQCNSYVWHGETYTEGGTYTKSYVNANGIPVEETLNLTIYPLPTVGIEGAASVCKGIPTELTATGAITYVWSIGNSHNASIVVTPGSADTYIYTVTGTDGHNCSATASHTLVVHPLPPVQVSGVESVCKGTSTMLTAYGANTYVWNFENTHDESIWVTPENADTYVYTVTGTESEHNCSATASHTLVVHPLPPVEIRGEQEICKGVETKLTALGANTYVWEFENTNANIEHAYIESIWVGPESTVVYTVTGTDNHNCTATASHTLVVHPLPQVEIYGEDTICEGNSTMLIAYGADTYVWDFENTRTDLIWVTPENPNIYTYTVTGTENVHNCSAKFSHKLVVNPIPDIRLVTSAERDSICKGQSIVLEAVSETAVEFQWPFHSNSFTESSLYACKPDTTARYFVVARHENGCVNTDTITIQVDSINVAITSTDTICKDEKYTMYALAVPHEHASFTWKDQMGNVLGQADSLIINGIEPYKKYYLEAKDDITGCTAKDSQKVSTWSLPAITLEMDEEGTVCRGDEVELKASGADGNKYWWSIMLPPGYVHSDKQRYTFMKTTEVWVKGKDEHGCVNSDTLKVEVDSTRMAMFVTDSLCLNQEYTIHTLVIPPKSQEDESISYNYTWKDGNGHILGQADSLNIVGVEPYGEYNLEVEHVQTGCKISDVQKVYLKKLEVTITGETEVCKSGGDPVTLQASAHTTSSISYIWEDGTLGSSITVHPQDTTQYKVSIISDDGCRGTDSITVNVHEGKGQHEIVGENETICNEYYWHGKKLEESGRYYSDLTTDENGCHCYDTLDLTLKKSSHNVFYAQSWGTYYWEKSGNSYEQGGNYPFDYTNDDGCPSVDTLKLTMIPSDPECINTLVVSDESCDPGNDGEVMVNIPESLGDDYEIIWDLGLLGSSNEKVVKNLPSGEYSLVVKSRTCDVNYYEETLEVKKIYCDEEPSPLEGVLVIDDNPENNSGSDNSSDNSSNSDYCLHTGFGEVRIVPKVLRGGVPPYEIPDPFYYSIPIGHSRVSRTLRDAIGQTDDPYLDFFAKQMKCALDPNEIRGPEGYSEEEHFVNAVDKMNYTINFENDPEFATAPASRVKVTYDVPAEQNIASFRLMDFGFGSFVFTVPSNTVSYYQRLDVSDSLGVWVDVTAGMDVANNQLFWIFQSIDPVTGAEPTSSQMGFLAINDSLGNGEGYVSFYIQPKNTVATGDTVNVDAVIVFDVNEPIPTNVWTNTIDAVAPSSTLIADINDQDSLYCTFTFQAQDDAGGSGVREVELFASKNNMPFTSLGITHPDSSITVALESGAYYQFMPLATDNVGNKEVVKAVADTSVNYNTAPTDLILSGNTFYEYDPVSTFIGTFSTTDDDLTLPFVYELVNGEGDADNALFTIEGNTLKTNASFVCSSRLEYSVRVRTTDFSGLYFEKSFLLREIRQHITPTEHIIKSVCSGSGFDFNGRMLTEGGVYTDTVQTADGCDSIVVCHFEIKNSFRTTDSIAVCPSALPYDWNGVSFAAADVDTVTLTAANGCDSVVMMTLTVKDAYEVADAISVCPSALPYDWNGVSFAAAGVDTVTLTAANGCDSVVVMTLTVKDAYEVADAISVFPSALPYTWNGKVFAAAGVDTVTLTAANGCDSVVVMTLTVNDELTYSEPITITSESAGTNGTILYDGQEHGNEYLHYTVTFGNVSLSPIEGSNGLKFAFPTLDTLTVTPTFEGITFNNAINDTLHNNVFTYTITHAEMYHGDRTVTYGTVNIDPLPVTITVDPQYTTKIYDGDTLRVNLSQLIFNTLASTDHAESGTIYTNGYQYGDYTCAEGGFMAGVEGVAVKENFVIRHSSGVVSTSSYSPQFNVVLSITQRPLTITANSDSKGYDGTSLTNSGFDLSSSGSPILLDGDSVSVTVVGTQTCLGESANVVTAANVLHKNSDGSQTDVTENYALTLVDGLLKVTPTTIELQCPDNINIILEAGKTDTTITPSLLGTPSHVLLSSGHTYVTHNMSLQDPLGVGVYIVTWTLYDECDSAMVTCNQTVVVSHEGDLPPCEGTITMANGTYQYKRIGTQCWFTENLREQVGVFHAYNDLSSNESKFGYLYTWYTAVGVPEGTTTQTPILHTAYDGTQYVQGICPDGWSIGSSDDYHVLELYAGGVNALKDPSTEFWYSGYEGINPGTGFNIRGSGWYNGALNRYEGLLTDFRIWKADATDIGAVVSHTSVIAYCVSYYCDHILQEASSKRNLYSVRCIRKAVQ